MPEYFTPVGNIEERSFSSKSIEGVDTNITGLIGPTREGSIGLRPALLTGLADFERLYGDRQPLSFATEGVMHHYLWHSARAFFEEGGKRLVPETPSLFDLFSVEYNLKLFARLFQIRTLRIEETLKEFNLLPFRRNRVQFLSKGLKQRVSIGRSLLADPPLLLFDEPTSGLDFEMTGEIYALLEGMHASGKTILFTSHRPEEIKTLATRMMVLHQGGLLFDGSPQEYFRSKIHEKLYA